MSPISRNVNFGNWNARVSYFFIIAVAYTPSIFVVAMGVVWLIAHSRHAERSIRFFR